MKCQARVLVFTGDGKGKSTAALGMAVRASGHGLRTKIIQFVKGSWTPGEIGAMARLPEVDLVRTGLGFVRQETGAGLAPHQAAAEDGLRLTSEAIASGDYHVIVLDEICWAVSRGLLDEAAVVELVQQAPADCCIVLTGRGATQGLIALADTVTEMRAVKHGLQCGITAQEGVEY